MRRVLPITHNGQLRDRYSLVALCYFIFPESEQTALRALEVLNAENDAVDAGLQAEHSEIGLMVANRINKRINNARIVGYVFYQMIVNKRKRGAADYRKAVFSVSEWASTTKTKRGKTLAASGDNIRKTHFPEFKSALHYWAAFNYLEDHELANPFNEPHFTKWMLAAAGIQMEAEEHRLHEGCEPLADWQPWRVPEQYVEAITSGRVIYEPQDENEEILARMKAYRAKPFDNSRGRA